MTGAYRRDIDGLRAVAVLMVIAFHAGWKRLPGGFVGVDVFFVISGYLIGSMIVGEVQAGRFSLLSFYERRVRRIFPALAAVILATSLLAWLFLLPSEMRLYGQSVIAATFSFANFHFARNIGYFVPWAGTLPLLHTWSLAIEEQFYLALPLCVLALHRLRPRLLWPMLLAATAASFAISLRGALAERSVDFYLPQTRAWELLLGTLLAWPRLPAAKTRLAREAAALVGLGLVLASGIILSDAMAFPGYAALAPCIGAVLLIHAGRHGDSLAGRGLSLSPAVFIGRISYSLYLWHWPVLVFLRMSDLVPAARQGVPLMLAAFTTMMLLATLSWRYVEIPFRYGPRRPGRATLFAQAGAAALVLSALGYGAVRTQGFPARFAPAALAVAGELHGAAPLGYFGVRSCFLDYDDLVANLKTHGCLRLDPARPNYLVLGDSYANNLWDGLSAAFPEMNFLQATGAGCTPRLRILAEDRCGRLMSFLFADFLLNKRPDKLVLAARWDFWNLEELSLILDWAAAHKLSVLLVGPIMRYDDKLPRLLALSIAAGDPGLPDAHRVDLVGLDQRMRALAEEKGAEYLSLLDALCQGPFCLNLAAPDVPLQYDDGHLTRQGAIRVAKRLRELGLILPKLADKTK